MCINADFEQIRPFIDSEAKEYSRVLLESKEFFMVMSSILKDFTPDKMKAGLENVNSIDDFKRFVITPMFNDIIDNTTNGVIIEGLENIDKCQSYLFISDHRDIILDSAILNNILDKHGYKTCEIAIGSNLLITEWITNLVKLNGAFTVKRNLPIKEMMESTKLLSSYIRNNLVNKNESVWIAQREGRTKDGDDRTQLSLLKMFNISGSSSIGNDFKELKIVPLAISYEYEPCDSFKTKETYLKDTNEGYTKTPMDDMNSMVAGLKNGKGKVHFRVGKPLGEILDIIDSMPSQPEKYKAIADVIDYRIHKDFKLWPNNYIAFDLLNSSTKYREYYTEADKELFISHMNEKLNAVEGNRSILNKIFLDIYANPVKNRLNLKKPDFCK